MGIRGDILIFVAVLAALAPFVLSAHVITPASFSVDEDTYNIYNISVNNTDSLNISNVSEVNITIPSTFTLVSGSNATDAGTHTFSNTTTVLSWNNDGLVLNNTVNYFWFNASASTPGSYNLTVTTTNSSGSYSSNLSVTVNDTGSPTSSIGTNPVADYNSSSNNVTFDLKCSDGIGVGTLQLWSNFSGSWAANQTNSSPSNDTYWNISVPGISDGRYVWGVYCNDSSGNEDWSANRTLTVDTTSPSVSISCTPSSVTEGSTVTCSCSGTDSTSGVLTTSYTANPSTSSTGTFSTSCTVTDYAGNAGASSFSYTVSGSGSVSGTSTPAPIKDSHSWTTVFPDSENIMENLNKKIAIEKIIFLVSSQSSDAKITVELDSKPTESLEVEAYQYFEISSSNLEDVISSIKISIRVPKTWVSQNGLAYDEIYLYKYSENSEEWIELETLFTNEDSEYYYYDIEMSTFSYFAIGSKEENSSPQEQAQTEGEQDDEDSVSLSGNAIEDSDTDESSKGILIAFIVVLVLGIGLGFYLKYKKRF